MPQTIKQQRLWSVHVRLIPSIMSRIMMANVTVAPYKAGKVNHVTINKTTKIIATIFVGHVQWAPSTIQTKTD